MRPIEEPRVPRCYSSSFLRQPLSSGSGGGQCPHAGMLCTQHFEARGAPKDDVVRHRVIVGHKTLNKFTGVDPQGVGPNQITVWRDTTSPVFKLRNESVILGAHLLGEFALRQPALLPQLAQPTARLAPQFLRQLGRSSLWMGIHCGFPK